MTAVLEFWAIVGGIVVLMVFGIFGLLLALAVQRLLKEEAGSDPGPELPITPYTSDFGREHEVDSSANDNDLQAFQNPQFPQ